MTTFFAALEDYFVISTHTSRVGCDSVKTGGLHAITISTHTSRVGCDTVVLLILLSRVYFYSHIPCGMWLLLSLLLLSQYISTHTSRVGCDPAVLSIQAVLCYFYSHIPCGMWRFRVSILPPHLLFLLTHPVWDVTFSSLLKSFHQFNFYSHIPCGMWRIFTRLHTHG